MSRRRARRQRSRPFSDQKTRVDATRRATDRVSPGGSTSTQGGRGPLDWFSSLSSGMKWLIGAVITAGAVASAIGSILALRPGPTPELSAAITKIWVDRNVTLAEYRARSSSAAFLEG